MKQNQQFHRAGKETINCRRHRAGMGTSGFPRRTSKKPLENEGFHWRQHAFRAGGGGRGKRLTQKETINGNPSKTLEIEAKSAIPQGWEGYG